MLRTKYRPTSRQVVPGFWEPKRRSLWPLIAFALIAWLAIGALLFLLTGVQWGIDLLRGLR